MTKKQRYIIFSTAILIVILLVLIPILKFHYFFYVDDFLFHFGRMENYFEAVKRGNLFPKVFPLMAGGSGYGVDIFYPSLPLLPYAFFRLFSNSFVAYKGYIFFIYLLTLFTSLISSLRIFKTMSARLFYIFAYVLNPYLFINIFLRGAFGEAIAISILPICFLGTWEIFKGNKKKWWILSIGMSLLLMCHLISTLLYALFLAILFITYLFSKERFAYFIALAKAAVLSLLLSCWQLIPVVEQNQAQKFAAFNNYFMPKSTTTLTDFIKNSFRFNFFKHGSINYSFVLFPIILLVVYFLLSKKKDAFILRVVIVSSILTLSMIRPWDLLVFDKTPLKIIQFSFRLTGITGFLFLFVSTKNIDIKLKEKKYVFLSNTLLGLSAICLLIISLSSFRAFEPAYWETMYIENLNNEVQELGGGFEYIKAFEDPNEHVKGLTLTNQLNQNKKNLTIRSLKRNQGTTMITVESKDYDLFETDLNYYKGYVAHTKAKNFKTTPVVEVRGRVAFVVEPGVNEVTIKYEKTIIQRISALISILGWVGLGYYLFSRNYTFSMKKYSHSKAKS